MKFKPLLKGLASYVPGLSNLMPHGTAGSGRSADYCYGVWMKHLTLLFANGMKSIPRSVAELGPGDSIGVGICALLSGSEKYCGLDVVRYSNRVVNLQLLDRLLELFRTKAARPTRGWPDFDRYLDSSLFPSHILTPEILRVTLDPERVMRIRKALADPAGSCGEFSARYIVPWIDPHVIARESIDLIVSHVVLQHILDIDGAYAAMREWLKPNGYMSHQIDLTSLRLTHKWNGHWSTPEWLWKISIGKRSYLSNRLPVSEHLRLLEKNGFSVMCDLRQQRADGISRAQLTPSWRHLSDGDLTCSNAFLQATKKG